MPHHPQRRTTFVHAKTACLTVLLSFALLSRGAWGAALHPRGGAPAEADTMGAARAPMPMPPMLRQARPRRSLDPIATGPINKGDGGAVDSAGNIQYYTNPVVPSADTPDPGVVYDASTKKYYATTTGNSDTGYFPLRESSDLITWTDIGFAMYDRPLWAYNSFWAPEIHLINGHQWTLYFTARSNKRSADGTNNILCIGVAVSTSGKPTGPYKDAIGKPLIEDTVNLWGHIDATYFFEEGRSSASASAVGSAAAVNGQGYLIFKRDGNAYGIHTPIHYAPLSANGTAIHPEGFNWRGTELISNTLSWEGGVVEAPWVVEHKHTADNKTTTYHFLFYSADVYSVNYAVGVARSTTGVRGPYTKHPTPILQTASGDPQQCPGHCSVVRRGYVASSPASANTDDLPLAMVYHAYAGSERGARHMSVDAVEWKSTASDGIWPSVHNGVPSHTPMPYTPDP